MLVHEAMSAEDVQELLYFIITLRVEVRERMERSAVEMALGQMLV